MDLTSYAELAVRLVNAGDAGDGRHDELATIEAYRALTADRAYLRARIAPGDLDALRQLRTELRLIFAACIAGNDEDAAGRLNALLARHPIHPEITRHDGEPWHLHHAESGSVADQYAAGAVLGLTRVVTELGTDRLRRCEAASCGNVVVDLTPGRSQSYCGDRCAGTANVTALRDRRRSQESGQASHAAV
ncbi:MAG TPA: CGNR zinc finger domain-containing protein [Streptosporangiaceae bacterium]|nr:CGNR zinc finger domain-containing protein [Streptosporangiaceae bacterium]